MQIMVQEDMQIPYSEQQSAYEELCSRISRLGFLG
jgi:hypothetical protein